MRERQEAIDDPPIEALAAEEAFSPRIRDAGEMLESIRELIDAGRIERARAQLEALERIHPEVEVPAEILKALESQSP